MDKPEVRERRVSRVILLDEEGRVLLFDTALAYTHAWIAPGGALEPGESFEEGALRELEEETGLRDVVLGPCVWTTRFRFSYDGVIYEQHERYYVARTRLFVPGRDQWTESERREIVEHQWWSQDEIASDERNFRPAEIAVLLSAVIDGRYPNPPVVASVERGARTV
jgi:8-oxo-dGTP pyrophosphatase MutT (NUDIX family)